MPSNAEVTLDQILEQQKTQTLLLQKIATDLGDLAFMKRTEAMSGKD